MAVFNKGLLVALLCQCGIAARRLSGVELNHGHMEVMKDLNEGIDDDKMAPDFDKAWTNETELKSQRAMLRSVLRQLQRKELTFDSESYVHTFRLYWMLEMQKDLELLHRYQTCPEICMWCEPTKDELEAGEGFSSFLITRASQWSEKFNLLKPSSEKECGHVGFEFYQAGKHISISSFSTSMHSMLSSSDGLEELRDWTAENKEEVGDFDVTALSHCEWLRRNQTDLRHAESCMYHTMLCNGPAVPIPNPNPVGESTEKFCRRVSEKWGPGPVDEISPDDHPAKFFKKAMQEQEERERARQKLEAEKAKELKERQKKCIELLCKWGGFKKASLKLHPDRLIRMKLPEEEKELRTETFKYLVGCKDDLQLTLSDKAERETTCATSIGAGIQN